MQLRKRPRGLAKKNRDSRIRSPRHLAFVRKHMCLVDGCTDRTRHAHHLAQTHSSAMGLKTGDHMTVPLCYVHHAEIHTIGEHGFKSRHGDVELLKAARILATKSPDEAVRAAVKQEEQD